MNWPILLTISIITVSLAFLLQRIILKPDPELVLRNYFLEKAILERRFRLILDQIIAIELERSMNRLSRDLKRKKNFRWLEKIFRR